MELFYISVLPYWYKAATSGIIPKTRNTLVSSRVVRWSVGLVTVRARVRFLRTGDNIKNFFVNTDRREHLCSFSEAEAREIGISCTNFIRRSSMCWLLAYFLVLIQNELRVICDWSKICTCLFSTPPPPLQYLLAHL